MIIGRTVFEANPSSNDLWMSQQLANFYADIGMRGEVQTGTMEALGISALPEYTVSPLVNSQLLEIVVTDTSPVRAQAVANELANQLIQRSPTASTQGQEHSAFVDDQINYLEVKIRETLEELDQAERSLTELDSARQIADANAAITALQTQLSQLQTNYAALISNTDQGAMNTLTVIEYAPLPTRPIGPNLVLIVAMAALIAVMVATGAAYLLDYLDDTIKNTEDVNNLLAAPVLATISMIGKRGEPSTPTADTPVHAIGRKLGDIFPKRQKPGADENSNGTSNGVFIYTSNHPNSNVAEEFRSLRINLDFARVDKQLRTILVTSPSPAEGKTSVATNLAIVMAQSGKKVILLDADFRKPSIDTHFHIPNKRGLSDIFRDNTDIHSVVQHWREKILWIITTGITPPNPVDLLSSQKMDHILAQLQEMADVVIIDGPPLIFPDSLALSTKVDGVLMVLRHAYTRRGVALSRYKQLTQVDARVIGVVLNKTPNQRVDYYKRKYYNRYSKEIEVEPQIKRVN